VAPIVLTSTYHQGGPDTYGRDANPTWSALEELIGRLEGGTALVFGSGMAAVSAVLELLPVPGRVVVPADAYNGTRRFLTDVAGRGRLRFRTVDLTDTAGVLEACAELTGTPGRPAGAPVGFGSGGVLWIESPGNPLLGIADVAALASGAHDLGMDVVVDNTFASPLLQRPLELGADVVVHSATKLLAGHSDVVMGAAVTYRPDLAELLQRRRSLHGAVAGPVEAWLTLRGMRTLALRLERSCDNAMVLAESLSSHPFVHSVRYPGLASHPGHALAARQMSAFGPVVSFEIAPGAGGTDPAEGPAVAAEAALSRLKLLTVGTSLGGVETLIERRGRWEGEGHLPAGLVRMSVGIEDAGDLWRDLDQALTGAG